MVAEEWMKIKNKYLFLNIILSLTGFLFLIYYIFRASANVVSSDYMRLGHYYLKDVHDLHFLFSIEGISRIPFTFLARIINVDLFKYNIFFDRILGIIGLTLFNFAILTYLDEFIKKDSVKIFSYIVCSFVIFSLNDWEMILNGTGYVHFISIAFVALSIIQYEKNDKMSLLLLFIASIIFGGQYGVSFDITFIFISLLMMVYRLLIDKKIVKNNFLGIKSKSYSISIIYIVLSTVMLILFLISNNSGEPLTIVGAHDITFIEMLNKDILFPVRFMLKSFASSLIGVETFTYAMAFNTIDERMIYFVGVLFLLVILFALYIFIYYLRNNKLYLVPFMFIIMGIFNYGLVFLARYIFLRDDYGMSSRYQLQYMVFIIGMLMYIFKFLEDLDLHKAKNKLMCIFKLSLIIVSLFIVVYCRLITNLDEIFKADYRKIIYNNLVDIARNYKDYSEEDIMNYFEYHRDYKHIEETLDTLKEQHLNVYSD